MNNSTPLVFGRRRFNQGLAALGLTWSCGGSDSTDADAGYLLASASEVDGKLGLLLVGDEVRFVATGFRGHGLCLRPGGASVVLVERTLGTTAVEVDRSGRLLRSYRTRVDRRVQGHAAFDAGAQRLYITEADRETSEGYIGVYDAATGARQGEYRSGGLGPHELLMLPSGRLVIANGGLHKRQTDVRVLNLDTMDSSLVYLDPLSGTIEAQFRVSSSKVSLRHLALSPTGEVVVSGQVQRPAVDHDDGIPLAYVHRPGGRLEPMPISTEVAARVDDYFGSVAADREIAVFTSARGDRIAVYDLGRRQFLGTLPLESAHGAVVTSDGRILVTGSSGTLYTLGREGEKGLRWAKEEILDVRWDNHILYMPS